MVAVVLYSLHLSPKWLHILTDLLKDHYTIHVKLICTNVPPSAGFSGKMSHVSLLVRSQLALANVTFLTKTTSCITNL